MFPTHSPLMLYPFLPSSMWSVILLHRYISVLGLASHFSPFRLLNVAMETFTLINPTGEEGTTDGKKTHQNSGGKGGAERRLAERSREEEAHRRVASGLRPRASARTPRLGDPVTARCKSGREISKARAVLPGVRVRLVSPRIAGAPGTRALLSCARTPRAVTARFLLFPPSPTTLFLTPIPLPPPVLSFICSSLQRLKVWFSGLFLE